MGVGLNFLNTSPGRPGQEIMNAVELKQWMDGLNVGDKWVVANPSRLFVRNIVVLRKTPTQLVVIEGGVEHRYRLKDGRRVGDNFETISPPSSAEKIAEARAAIKAHRLAVAFSRMNWRNLPLEKLEQVAALIGVEVAA